jgi:hypothetical protein
VATTLDACDDMWTHLWAAAARLCGARLIVARVGQPWEVELAADVTEVRVADTEKLWAWRPDLVVDRGGYADYMGLLRISAAAGVPGIYVGAGRRWNPAVNRNVMGIRYDAAILDSPMQQTELGEHGFAGPVMVLHKPAAPCFSNALFRREDTEKKFDLVFISSQPTQRKGCQWLAARIPDGCRVLRIGPADEWFEALAVWGGAGVEFTGPLPRACVPAAAARGRVGVVCDDGERDSGPRVLTELLAIDRPVIVRNTVRADLEALVTPESGVVIGDGEGELAEAMGKISDLRSQMDPRGVYDRLCRMDVVAAQVAGLVSEITEGGPD